jgi:hypothetical protein
MAGHVEHRAAVGETRVVEDLDRDDFERIGEELPGLDGCRQKLPQRLHPVREPCSGGCSDADSRIIGSEPVPLGGVTIGSLVRAEHEHDIAGLSLAPHDGQLEAARRPQQGGDLLCNCPDLRRVGVHHDPRVGPEAERVTPNAHHLDRLRHDRNGRRRWRRRPPPEHGDSGPHRRRGHERRGQHPNRAPLHRVQFPSRV